MKLFAAMCMLFVVGCIQVCPTVNTTKCYEGHFYNKADAISAVQHMELDKNESVWILSNTTLKRVIINSK